MIKVIVDMNLCQSHGECVHAAPDVFELGADDELSWREEVPEDERERLEEAANICPMMAISLSG